MLENRIWLLACGFVAASGGSAVLLDQATQYGFSVDSPDIEAGCRDAGSFAVTVRNPLGDATMPAPRLHGARRGTGWVRRLASRAAIDPADISPSTVKGSRQAVKPFSPCVVTSSQACVVRQGDDRRHARHHEDGERGRDPAEPTRHHLSSSRSEITRGSSS